MKIINYQPSFAGLRVNRISVVEKCASDKKASKEVNSTIANFVPRVDSVWGCNENVGLFFKDQEQEKTVKDIFDNYGIKYEQSQKIDQYDHNARQVWVETGILPE